MLKRPKILIFDEATSSLDGATEKDLIRTINQLKGKVAILYITHRLSEAAGAKLVLNLNDYMCE